MEGNYGVYFGEALCGKVQVKREGLYYRFTCRCCLTGQVVCRLFACMENGEENVGVVVPMDGGFGLNSRIPAKRFCSKLIRFELAPRKEKLEGNFVAICPEEPFAYIERLKEAYLVKKYGQVGVSFRKKAGV